jgi:hypothetical protein
MSWFFRRQENASNVHVADKPSIKDFMPPPITRGQLDTLIEATSRGTSRQPPNEDEVSRTMRASKSLEKAGEDILKATQEEIEANVASAVETLLDQPFDLVVEALEVQGLLLGQKDVVKERRARAIAESVAKAVNRPRYHLEQAIKILEAARILTQEDRRDYDDESPICDIHALLGRVEGTVRQAVAELKQGDD